MKHMLCAFREVKAQDATDDGQTRFVGYGAYFGNVDSYGDAIEKGAFKRTLKEAKKSGIWPAMLSQHGGWGITASDLTPVGLWDALDEDEKGLAVSGILAPTPRGQELGALMKMQPRPAINGLSIGYVPKKWKTNANPQEGEPRRVLTDVDLWEISPVTWPANDLSRISGVKADEWTKRRIEHALRDADVPAALAKRVASLGMAGLASGIEIEHRDGAGIASIAESLRALSNSI